MYPISSVLVETVIFHHSYVYFNTGCIRGLHYIFDIWLQLSYLHEIRKNHDGIYEHVAILWFVHSLLISAAYSDQVLLQNLISVLEVDHEALLRLPVGGARLHPLLHIRHGAHPRHQVRQLGVALQNLMRNNRMIDLIND